MFVSTLVNTVPCPHAPQKVVKFCCISEVAARLWKDGVRSATPGKCMAIWR